MQRIILHLDLDAFYAQCEELRNPSLKDKPVVVCVYSGRTPDSGAVGTANYEARKLGIHSGMPIIFAKKKANTETIFLPVDIPYYKSISERIMEIAKSNSGKTETAGLDEAYLDVSTIVKTFEGAEQLAKKLKKEIIEQEGLTCSVGIGQNKLIAKMASDFRKPDGLTVVKPEKQKEFISGMGVKKLFGIGPKTEEALLELGIKTIAELAAAKKEFLVESFGEKKGQQLHEFANGIDERPVEENIERQQFSRIGTLKDDSGKFSDINPFLEKLCQDLFERIFKEKKMFRSVSIIVITDKFQSFTKSRTLEAPKNDLLTITEISAELLREFLSENKGVSLRRIGVRVSNLLDAGQLKKNQKTLEDF
jgi:DNA polymerase IV (DinB-like DNA polymerase)